MTKRKKPNEKTKIDPTPWLVPDAIDFLGKIVEHKSKSLSRMINVVETGAGGSTLYFAGGPCNLISFEHNKSWFDVVDRQLEEYDRTFVDLRFDPNYPKAGIRSVRGLKFDVALIDGRGRNRSIATVLRHMKPDSFVILDNSDRRRYDEGKKLLDAICQESVSFKKRWETTFWRLKK